LQYIASNLTDFSPYIWWWRVRGKDSNLRISGVQYLARRTWLLDGSQSLILDNESIRCYQDGSTIVTKWYLRRWHSVKF